MFSFLIIVHVLMCFVLILIVLLQTGKGADMGAAFGGSSQTLFGSAGPTSFLGRITTVAAVIFMVTSLTLAWWSSARRAESILPYVKGGRVTNQSKVPAQGMPSRQQGIPPQTK